MQQNLRARHESLLHDARRMDQRQHLLTLIYYHYSPIAGKLHSEFGVNVLRYSTACFLKIPQILISLYTIIIIEPAGREHKLPPSAPITATPRLQI